MPSNTMHVDYHSTWELGPAELDRLASLFSLQPCNYSTHIYLRFSKGLIRDPLQHAHISAKTAFHSQTPPSSPPAAAAPSTPPPFLFHLLFYYSLYSYVVYPTTLPSAVCCPLSKYLHLHHQSRSTYFLAYQCFLCGCKKNRDVGRFCSRSASRLWKILTAGLAGCWFACCRLNRL